MKKEKTYHGYYHSMRMRDKKNRYLISGRSLITMSDMKCSEYNYLRRYIKFKFKPHFGYRVAIDRFYKNLKYRKTFIRLMNKNKAE